MEILIKESQLNIILQEQKQEKISSYMKELNSFTKKLISSVEKNYGLNIRFLLTWGASVAGLVMPLDNYIRTGDFNLTEEQIDLVLVGVICTYFYDNSKILKTVLSKIKELGLESTFKEVYLKSKDLTDSFSRFLNSINVSLDSTLNLVTYTFLIPIVNDLLSLFDGGDLQTTAMTISKRLVASGVVLVGQIVLTDIIKKIIKKLD
jgi:hypothetical protein